MSEKPSPSNRFRRLAVFLTMAATVAASVVAGLQADASIRSDVANRDSQYYAILASGELYRQGLASDYDFGTLSAAIASAQEATLLQLTALEQESRSELEAAAASRRRAAEAQARSDRLGMLSELLTDPAYAPAEAGAPPDLQGYLDGSYAEANRLVGLQNEAADRYDAWNMKSDTYVAVLALSAMVLFLYGMAQATSEQMRLPFLGLGSAVFGLSLAWTLSILLR